MKRQEASILALLAVEDLDALGAAQHLNEECRDVRTTLADSSGRGLDVRADQLEEQAVEYEHQEHQCGQFPAHQP
ncbi:hypothetical protein D3C84_919480 [compost metagenome]